MIKNLVSFGCSWTYGDELSEANDHRLHNSFPGIIANKLGLTLENLAQPGMSLISMSWELTNWLNNHTPQYISESMIIVGLTFSNRYSWYNAHRRPGEYKYVDSLIAQGEWETVHKMHYTLADSDELNQLTYQSAVRAFDDVGVKFNIPVIQFNVACIKQDAVPHVSTVYFLNESIEEKIIRTRNNYYMPGGHLNEAGHIFQANLLLDEITKLNLKVTQ